MSSLDESEFSEVVDEEDPRWEDARAYCICRGRDNGEFMINCEGCEEWYHGRCIGIAESQGPHIDNYYCPNCAAAGKGHTTYKGFGKRGTETRGDVETSAPKRQKLSLDEKKKFDMHRKREESEKRRAERAERTRQKEEGRRREREDNAAKLALDAESRARELELKKKKDEEDLKLRREKMRASIASTIEEAFGKDQESKSIDKDLLENLKPIPQLAEDIEVALFEASIKSIDKAYLNQYRTLVYNLRDVKNTALRFRILKGLLKPSVLVTMDSEQLANKDIAQYRQKRDQELLLLTQKPKDTDRLYVKTDIGLELVPPVGDDDDLDYVDSALDSLLDANKVMTEKAKEEGELVDNKSETLESGQATGSPLRESGGRRQSHERSDAQDERSATPVKTPVKFEPRSNPTTPLTSSFGAPPLTASFEGYKKTIAAVDLDDIGDLGDEGLEEPEMEEGDAMDLGNDSKPDHNSFGVATPENSDDEANHLFGERLPSSLPTWAGIVKYQFQGLDLALPLSGFHVEGPEIGENLPRSLKVEHRMDLKQLLDYLPKLDTSSSRARTTMYFTVADSNDESSYENYARLFQHLKEINRAGVFQLHKGEAIGVPPTFFKELYVLPLGATDPKPKFIDDSRNYDRDLQNTLVGVFLTERQKAAASSSRRPSSSVPAALPVAQEAPSAGVTPAESQAKLDSIASLIAALGKPQAAPAPAPAPPPPVAAPVPAFNLASLLGNVANGVNPLASLFSAAQPSNPLASLFGAMKAQAQAPPASSPDAPYDPLGAGQAQSRGDRPQSSAPYSQPPQYQAPAHYPSQYPPPQSQQQYPPQQGSAYPSHRQEDHNRGYDNNNRGGHGYDNQNQNRNRFEERNDNRNSGYDNRSGGDNNRNINSGYDNRNSGHDNRSGGYDNRPPYDERDHGHEQQRGGGGGGYDHGHDQQRGGGGYHGQEQHRGGGGGGGYDNRDRGFNDNRDRGRGGGRGSWH